MLIDKDQKKIRARLENQRDYYLETCKTKSSLLFCRHEGIQNPFITICIPTYNRDDIKKTIESVLGQKECGLNYCVIVIDNDPDMKKVKLLNYLKTVFIPDNCCLYYYKNQKNIGMFGNWNKCIELAKTDYIGMVHDDDILYDDYLKRISKIINKYSGKKLGYIRCAGDQIYGNINKNNHKLKNRLKKYYNNKLNKVSKLDCYLNGSAGGLGSPTCGSIINKKALIEVKGYNLDFYPTSDCYPPYLMLQNYNVYVTIASFGAKYFGKNESVKIEVMRGWLREYLYFQQYMASESVLGRVIISYFGDQQYFNFINKYLKQLLEVGGQAFESNMFDDIYVPHKSRIKGFLLKFLIKLRIYYTYGRTLLLG